MNKPATVVRGYNIGKIGVAVGGAATLAAVGGKWLTKKGHAEENIKETDCQAAFEVCHGDDCDANLQTCLQAFQDFQAE